MNVSFSPSSHYSIMEIRFSDGFRQSEIPVGSVDRERYERSKFWYERNKPSQIIREGQAKIPCLIHHIWVGPKKPPEYLQRYRDRIGALHPGYECHLWSMESLEPLKLPDWDLIQRSTNWGEKADIIKANLLERFGGLVLDADMQVLRPMDELFSRYDFFAGLEQPRKCEGTPYQLWVGVAFIGSRPGHPIIRRWRECIRNSWNEEAGHPTSVREMVLRHTYYPFTEAVFRAIGDSKNVDILFPPTYLYGKGVPVQEAIAVHHSAEEWLQTKEDES